MAVNQILAGSLTSALLANVGGPAASPTFTDARFCSPSAWVSELLPARPDAEASVIETVPAWQSHLAANARLLSELTKGWDGPGSLPIPQTTLFLASTLAHNALRGLVSISPPRLVPAGDGSVQIEWHTRNGELEFDLDVDGHMSIWVKNRRNGAEFEGENEEALALFYRWAPWVAARPSNAGNVQASQQMPTFSIAA